MNNEQILDAACEYVSCTAGQVLKYRVEDGCAVLVVDRGVAGCPKYKVSLTDLAEKPAPEPAPEPVAEVEAVNATAGAEKLAAENGIELVDVAAHYDLDRVTYHDVKRYLEGAE